ncbi:MAG: cyclic nucleotide-binding domain-containing protein [Gammaproteobacteria bacterium]|jgi:CRP-like cAMP-binding protein|nr:cyclic nucleotide-binding domain-containing protein [Gammaproteobacteria bacterium]MDH3749830.1 cyclic nucleotide-binding domain-containing protein [Gammaproteobacteria bacterium]MDH3805207.1 cyclic nucleotide-binding domain-containing protein [Gammaproteobacteria bacterium]
MDNAAHLVLQSSLGAELSQEEAAALGDIMSPQDLADGDYLISEGAADDSLHVLLGGKLEVIKHAGADETVSLAVLREGDLAGELSFIDGAIHTVGLRALCDSRILTLKREEFESIVDGNPQLVYKVMRAVARSAHRIVHRMNYEFVELNNYIFKQHGRY